MITRRHALEIGGLVAAALPLAGLLYWASQGDTRSAAGLETADRCVDAAHAASGTSPSADPRCDLYFRTRSDAEADADEERWRKRQKAQQLSQHP